MLRMVSPRVPMMNPTTFSSTLSVWPGVPPTIPVLVSCSSINFAICSMASMTCCWDPVTVTFRETVPGSHCFSTLTFAREDCSICLTVSPREPMINPILSSAMYKASVIWEAGPLPSSRARTSSTTCRIRCRAFSICSGVPVSRTIFWPATGPCPFSTSILAPVSHIILLTVSPFLPIKTPENCSGTYIVCDPEPAIGNATFLSFWALMTSCIIRSCAAATACSWPDKKTLATICPGSRCLSSLMFAPVSSCSLCTVSPPLPTSKGAASAGMCICIAAFPFPEGMPTAGSMCDPIPGLIPGTASPIMGGLGPMPIPIIAMPPSAAGVGSAWAPGPNMAGGGGTDHDGLDAAPA
mmetsp:Transcript_33232/g.70244  ORF Transcript_33232/g.70244 Transcript_33232/m.70244 type:complete len:353 (+) Transcript_33232:1544-2602(+)